MTVGPDVLVGILSSIVYDGIKRPIKGIVDAVGVRRNVKNALSSGKFTENQQPAEFAEDFKNLVKILGNEYNAYDENIARFLQEVERSAIPDALKQFSLCGHDVGPIYPSFELIYNSYSSLPFEPEKLFAALNAAIKTKIEQSVQEKTLFDAVKRQHEEVYTKVNQISACLNNAKSIREPLNIKEYEEIREKIAKGIENANRQINVETTQGTRKININKLVINARLEYVSEKGNIPAAHREARAVQDNTVSYLNFRRAFNRSVILGDPGGGKSTLTQLLCFDMAKQILLAANNPKYTGFDSRDLRLPIRIVLRSLEKRQNKDPSYQIIDYIVDEIRVFCDSDRLLAERFIKQTLTLGQAVLLFDGLDEILDVDSRRNMSAYIEQFNSVYATCPALVTSRIVGYNDAPLDPDYDIFTLSRFNREEIRKFAENLIKAIASEKLAVAKDKAEHFLHQTESTANDLRENPLLLGLMVYIFNTRGEVPSSRPEIYKECSILMFEKWDQRRDIKFDFPQDFDLLDLFGFLATQIFGDAETEDGVSEHWLLERLKEYFNIWYQDKARSISAAKVLVEFITGRAWVMCEIGPRVFKFTHRTFLEYFFAKRIEEEAGSVTALLNGKIIDKIVKAQWDVVNHLALQIATFRSGPKSIQAIDSLLRAGLDSHFAPSEELNYLSFLARSLDYLLIPESQLEDALNFIFRRSVTLGANYSLNATTVIGEALNSTQRRGAFATETLVRLIEPIVRDSSSPERAYVFYLLGLKHGIRASRRVSIHADSIWSTFRSVRLDAQPEQWDRAATDVNEARIYVYVYGDRLEQLYTVHGVSLLFVPSSGLVPFELSHLAYIVVHEAVRLSAGMVGPRFFDLNLPKEEVLSVLNSLTDTLLDAWKKGVYGEIIPSSSEKERFPLIDELVHYIRYSVQRRRSSKSKAFQNVISRALFFYSLVGFQSGDYSQFRKIISPVRKSADETIFPSELDLEKNEFTTAITQMHSSKTVGNP